MQGLYRGKKIGTGEWAYGCYAEFVNYLDGDTKPGIQIIRQVPSAMDRFLPAWETELIEVDPKTVGQGSGIDDLTGREIYKGDIVKQFGGHVFTVDYQDGAFVLIGSYGASWRLSNVKNVEKIGTIWDNPELLGER